ncbi:MAG: SGNH/GDSL hydrolase family protein [Acidobacteriota bacterium]
MLARFRVLSVAILLMGFCAAGAAYAQQPVDDTAGDPAMRVAPQGTPKTPAEERAAKRQANHDMHQDFPGLRRFEKEDADLGPAQPDKPRVVFMGDSITSYWMHPNNNFFTEEGYINRGMGGQTTQQMLLRFRQDVVNLGPRVVVILAGTNDIAANTGLTTVPAIENNLMSMVDLARSNHIRVVLCTLLPAAHYPWRPEIVPAPIVAELNAWIRQYAAQQNIKLVDLFAAMSNPDGSMKSTLSNEGVHPNPTGYAVMKPLIGAAVESELAKKPGK